MRLIDADVLLEKVQEIRKLALDRAVETPANMPFPIYQNPAYTRYSTQADEREKFKVMIEDASTVQPELDIRSDGTLRISVAKGQLDKIGRVLVEEDGTVFCKMFY